MKQPPNILFLMADQLAPHFMPAYGHKVVKTPRLDDMAADSTIFDGIGLGTRMLDRSSSHSKPGIDR